MMHIDIVVGAGRFYDNIELMVGFKILPWFKICWMVLSPLASGVCIALSLVGFDPSEEF